MTSLLKDVRTQAGSEWASNTERTIGVYTPFNVGQPEPAVAPGIWLNNEITSGVAVVLPDSPGETAQTGSAANGSVVLAETEAVARRILGPSRPIAFIGRIAIGLTAMFALSAVAQTQFVPSPKSLLYDFNGALPSVAISGTSVVEVHQSSNALAPLWYRSGRIQADGTVAWYRSFQFDNAGEKPSVAVSGVNVVEVHEGTANGFGPLWYRTGKIQPDGSVSWSNSQQYDNGARPSVAVSGNNVIEVHQGTANGFGVLWYKAGQVRADGSVAWADNGHPYDYGGAPRVAASGPNIIEVHQGTAAVSGPLWYKTAQFKADGSVVWAGAGYNYETGGAPSVSLTGATILEVHEAGSNSPVPLRFRAGHIQPDGSVVWTGGSQYDRGGKPSIALAGAVALEVHQAGAGFGWEFYRTFRY